LDLTIGRQEKSKRKNEEKRKSIMGISPFSTIMRSYFAKRFTKIGSTPLVELLQEPKPKKVTSLIKLNYAK
jgi:hypothetical protein